MFHAVADTVQLHVVSFNLGVVNFWFVRFPGTVQHCCKVV